MCNPDRVEDVGSTLPSTPVVGRFSGPAMSGSCPVAGSPGPVGLVEGGFFIFIFFKNIFYINIFSVSHFTVLYPSLPPGRGRQGPTCKQI